MKTLTQLLEQDKPKASGQSMIPGDKEPVKKTPEPTAAQRPNLELAPNTQLNMLDERKLRKDQFKQQNDELLKDKSLYTGKLPVMHDPQLPPRDVYRQVQAIRENPSHKVKSIKSQSADPDNHVSGMEDGVHKINPYAFFIEPNQKESIRAGERFIKDAMPWLHDLRDEEYLNRVLTKPHGNMAHEVYDHVSNGMIYDKFKDDEMVEYAKGLSEGRITNPRIALDSLFRSTNVDDGPLDLEGTKEFKRGIMQQLFHPSIQEEYQYDMLQTKLEELGEDGELDEADFQEMQRLSDSLIGQGYTFEAMDNPLNRGSILEGRRDHIPIEEFEEALSNFTFEPNDMELRTFMPRYGFGPYQYDGAQKENLEMLNMVEGIHGEPEKLPNLVTNINLTVMILRREQFVMLTTKPLNNVC